MKKIMLTLIASLVITLTVFTQSAGDYISIANGNWNDATKWEIYNGSNWVTAARYPGQDPGTGTVYISAFHEIRITASVPHPVASLSLQRYFDEYWTYEIYLGTLTFSAESSISLTVSGNIYAPGMINVNDQAGFKSHTLFIGGSFNGTIEAISADDDLSVIFNSTVSNTTIEAYGIFQDVTLNGNAFTVHWMTVNGSLTFVNGVVKIPYLANSSRRIHFRKGATWSGASNTLYVDGKVSKEGDEPFTFPIGQNGIYAPLSISAPVGATEIFAAKYTRASASDLAGIRDPGLFNVSQCEYWELTPGEGQYGPKNYPLSITVGWNSSSNCGTSPYITNVSDVALAHSDGSVWGSHGGEGTGTITSGSVTWSGVTTTGYFTFGNVGTCKTPSALTATNITGNSATISWSPEPGAASYDVYYKDYPYWPIDQWLIAATATTATSANLSGLNQASPYYYRVRANCSEGSSSYRQSEFTTLTVCERPTGLTTTNITNVSATFNWDRVPGATGYQIELGRGYGNNWVSINGVITSTSYTVSNLTSTYYTWRVRAICPGGISHYQNSEIFLVPWEPPVCNDIYETNNSSSQAKAIDLGVTISGAISSDTDEDWFKITTPNTSNTTLQVMLSTLPADYDLYVYDKRFKLVGSSIEFGNSNEIVVFNSSAKKASYFIKVNGKYGYYNTSQCYNLLAQVNNFTSRSITVAPVSEKEINEELVRPLLNPNPASQFLYLNFSSVTGGLANIQIINSTGQLVKKLPVNTTKGNNQIKLLVADIRPGMYILRINKGGLTVTKKFMIAR